MQKQKAFQIAGSNLENFGSDLERKVKETAAACEEEWHKTDAAKVGLLIWRIEQFKVVAWPEEEYGSFYDGDSYIVLNTYKVQNKLMYDVHFWLGQDTTQDEAGTAAYKTVELDTYLKDAAVQHREVMGYESSLFLSYFPNGVRLLSGGVASGFRHVEAKAYQPRLLHIKGKRKNIQVMQVPLACSSLNDGDAFVLDAGLKVFQWHGTTAGIFEKNKAAQVVRALDDERANVEIEVLDADGCDEFWALLGGRGDIAAATSDDDFDTGGAETRRLMRVSDASGKLEFAEIASGATVKRGLLDSNDVFVYDGGNEVFVWIGKGSSKAEKRSGMQLAVDYLAKYNRPAVLPISRVMEGGENEVFNASIAA